MIPFISLEGRKLLTLDLIMLLCVPVVPTLYPRVAFPNTLSLLKQDLLSSGKWNSKRWSLLVLPDSCLTKDLLTYYCIFQNCSNPLDFILLLLLLLQMKMWQTSNSWIQVVWETDVFFFSCGILHRKTKSMCIKSEQELETDCHLKVFCLWDQLGLSHLWLNSDIRFT